LAQAHRPQRLAALDRQHLWPVALLQPAAQPSSTAIDLVAGHPGHRDLGVQRPLQQHPGQPRLGAEADRIGDGRLPAARPILSQPSAGTAPGRSAHAPGGWHRPGTPQLAVLDPPGRARILPLDPGRLGALLEEPGLVDDQHRPRIAEVLQDIAAQVIADRISVPAGMVEQPLPPIWVAAPACSANCQLFLRSIPASRPRTNPPARRRTSTRWNRGAIRLHSASSSAAHPSTCATSACSCSPHPPSSNNRSRQATPAKCGCSTRPQLRPADPRSLA
jgi:hypothetical protein